MGFVIVGRSSCVIVVVVAYQSINQIGPTEVGLVTKRFGLKKLKDDNPIAFHGEAGYQADAADAGAALQAVAALRREEVPVGAGAGGPDRGRHRAGRAPRCRSAPRAVVYKPEFGNFSNLDAFIDGGGAEGCAAAGAAAGHAGADPPGRVHRAHVGPGLRAARSRPSSCTTRARPAACSSPRPSGSPPQQLQVVVIAPVGPHDMIGVVTVLEGPPLLSGDIASRLGGYDDVLRDGARRGRDERSRSHRDAARQQEPPAQQLPGLPAASSTPAARSVCSTTRCSTARTC